MGSLSSAAIDALIAGLQGAVTHPSAYANWVDLRTARREESARSRAIYTSNDDSGNYLLEVLEVERRLAGGSWATSWVPTERNSLSWRWVDSRGVRHSHIQEGLSREACAAK